MSIFEAQALLHERDDFFEMATAFVVVDQFLQMVRGDNDVQTSDLGEAELLGLDAGSVDLLPGADAVGLLGSLHSLTELAQSHKSLCKFRIVVDGSEKNLSSSVELLWRGK